jgi:predicted transcriptional regulator
MDSEADPDSVALLAIKPQFAQAIMEGRKRVEFRKTRFKQCPRFIVLYASTPIKQVVAYFEVAYIKELSPRGLWREFKHIGGIEYRDFIDYYGDRSVGFAIVIAAVWKLTQPARLNHLNPRGGAPQSFRYLRRDSIDRLSNWS